MKTMTTKTATAMTWEFGRLVFLVTVVLVTGWGTVGIHAADPGRLFGLVEISRAVRADGAVLAPGRHVIWITDEASDGERWVEIQVGTQVAGRELAPWFLRPRLAGGPDYRHPLGAASNGHPEKRRVLRVWINDAGMHHLIHLPLV